MSDEHSDIAEAMRAVVADMGAAAKKFKAKRYAPKEKAPEPKAEAAPEAEEESGMPTAGELESMLTEG